MKKVPPRGASRGREARPGSRASDAASTPRPRVHPRTRSRAGDSSRLGRRSHPRPVWHTHKQLTPRRRRGRTAASPDGSAERGAWGGSRRLVAPSRPRFARRRRGSSGHQYSGSSPAGLPRAGRGGRGGAGRRSGGGSRAGADGPARWGGAAAGAAPPVQVGRPDGTGPSSSGEDPSQLPGEPSRERASFWRWPWTPEFSPQRGQPFAKNLPPPPPIVRQRGGLRTLTSRFSPSLTQTPRGAAVSRSHGGMTSLGGDAV
nr:uncharacterized protein LOC112584002 [Bubalus bubalis]